MRSEPRLPDESVNVSRTHPLAEGGTLVTGIAVVSMLAFVAVAFLVDILVPFVPRRIERDLVDPLFAQIEERVVRGADEYGGRIEGLLGRLLLHWEDAPYDFEIVIMDEETPNAFALPGGLIVVTTGLISGVASENELAFVLGHELGHFRNRDHLRSLGRGALIQMVLGGIGIGSGGTGPTLLGATGLLASLGFSRRQESAADRFGVELLYREYGTVAGSSDFFDRISELGAASGVVANFVGTHPPSKRRVDELEGYVRDRGWPTDGLLMPAPQRAPRPETATADGGRRQY